MSTRQTATFNEALDIIESFPEEQKESIIEIVKHRLTEERRERLAQTVKEAREEYSRGEVRRGTVDDLIREIAR
jgi:ribosome recycling factor